jgi:hypothetical protein
MARACTEPTAPDRVPDRHFAPRLHQSPWPSDGSDAGRGQPGRSLTKHCVGETIEPVSVRQVAHDLCGFRLIVAAGQRALGPEMFREYAGHFWGMLETGPYMRAREGLACLLWSDGKRHEAIVRRLGAF